MLETWNLVRKYTQLFSFRKYLNFADANNFLEKIRFFCKNSTFTKNNGMSAML